MIGDNLTSALMDRETGGRTPVRRSMAWLRTLCAPHLPTSAGDLHRMRDGPVKEVEIGLGEALREAISSRFNTPELSIRCPTSPANLAFADVRDRLATAMHVIIEVYGLIDGEPRSHAWCDLRSTLKSAHPKAPIRTLIKEGAYAMVVPDVLRCVLSDIDSVRFRPHPKAAAPNSTFRCGFDMKGRWGDLRVDVEVCLWKVSPWCMKVAGLCLLTGDVPGRYAKASYALLRDPVSDSFRWADA